MSTMKKTNANHHGNNQCLCCQRKDNHKYETPPNASHLISNSESPDNKTKQELSELRINRYDQDRPTCFVFINFDSIPNITCLQQLNYSTILHPFGTFRIFWDLVIMLILIFTCFEIPLTLAFAISVDSIQTSYGKFVLIIDLILCIDIVFNFRTAFYNHYDALKLEFAPGKVFKRYLHRWFVIDFFTSFPFEFLMPSNVDLHGTPALLRIFRIVRLIRLFKLIRFFRMLKLLNSFLREFMGPQTTLILRLLKLVAFMVMAAHFAACLWYYIGAENWCTPTKQEETPDTPCSWLNHQDVDPHDVTSSYLISLYWSIITLFTTGYGDIIPVNTQERMVAAGVVLLGTCFFAYLIGAVGSLIAEGDRIRTIQIQKFEEAQAFCAAKNIPADLTRAIMSHTTYFYKNNFVYDDEEILSSLPYGIQYDICKYYGTNTFGDFRPFDVLAPKTKGLLALRMRKISCNKDFTVYRHGEIAKHLYIQRTGKSCLVIPPVKATQPKEEYSDKYGDNVFVMVTDEKEYNDGSNDEYNDYNNECSDSEYQKQVSLQRSISHIPNFNCSTGQLIKNGNAPKSVKWEDLGGVKKTLRRGDMCGHVGFCDGRRNGSLHCVTWCEFWSLSIDDLKDVLSTEHPKDWKQLWKGVRDQMKSTNATVLPMKIGVKRMNSRFMSFFHDDSIDRDLKIVGNVKTSFKDDDDKREDLDGNTHSNSKKIKAEYGTPSESLNDFASGSHDSSSDGAHVSFQTRRSKNKNSGIAPRKMTKHGSRTNMARTPSVHKKAKARIQHIQIPDDDYGKKRKQKLKAPQTFPKMQRKSRISNGPTTTLVIKSRRSKPQVFSDKTSAMASNHHNHSQNNGYTPYASLSLETNQIEMQEFPEISCTPRDVATMQREASNDSNDSNEGLLQINASGPVTFPHLPLNVNTRSSNNRHRPKAQVSWNKSIKPLRTYNNAITPMSSPKCISPSPPHGNSPETMALRQSLSNREQSKRINKLKLSESKSNHVLPTNHRKRKK